MPPLSFYLSVIAFFFFPSTCKFVYVCVEECVCLRPPASAASCFNFPQDPGRKKKNLLSAASVAHSTLSILCYYVYGGKSIPALLWDTMKPRKHLACRDRMAEKKILQEKHPRRKKRKKKTFSTPRRWGPPEREQAGFKPTSSIRN